jgi:hypothetical protein
MKKWMVFIAGRLLLLFVLGLPAAGYAAKCDPGYNNSQSPDASNDPETMSFCAEFQKIVTNQLLGNLDPEFQAFIQVLQPDNTDVNGNFFVDTSNGQFNAQLHGNGIRDASNEMGVIEYIFKHPSEFPDGSPASYNQLRAAWCANRARLIQDIGPLYQLVNGLVPGLSSVLLGYIIMGDGESTVISAPDPNEGEDPTPFIVEGTGSWGFAASLYAVLAYFAKKELNFQFASTTLDKANYITLAQLTPSGDVDNDGFTNLCESRAFPRTLCDGNPTTHYVQAATSATLVPNGCFEVESECTINLTTDQVVPPSTVQNALGDVKITTLYNATTNQRKYELVAFHTVTYAVSAEIRQGAPGENGPRAILVNNGTLPMELTLTPSQVDMLRLKPHYFSIFRQQPQEGETTYPVEEAVRGQIDCFPPLGGSWITCEAVMNGDNMVPPISTPRSGLAVVSLNTANRRLLGFWDQNLANAGNASLNLAPPTENGPVLYSLSPFTPSAPNMIDITLQPSEVSALLAGNVYIVAGPPSLPDGLIRGNFTCSGTPEGEGQAEGIVEGQVEGTPEGVTEGQPEGTLEGQVEGTPEGVVEGQTEGTVEGVVEGQAEGTPEGTAEGEGSGQPTRHSADQNGDNRINLSELLRVIQFFNSGGYSCAIPPSSTEDGYVPGPTGNQTCTPHASDYNPQDWRISLSELLRLIQFFNSGGYHPCAGSEDGFCPGP